MRARAPCARVQHTMGADRRKQDKTGLTDKTWMSSPHLRTTRKMGAPTGGGDPQNKIAC